ncbi:hypothetical protein GGR52DRAFT_451779 [Hypoxylon sp. FL1284]|nr:hypothetical protein GGR52DRAFT_451779 [Hypoxylon sp. FL1284]
MGSHNLAYLRDVPWEAFNTPFAYSQVCRYRWDRYVIWKIEYMGLPCTYLYREVLMWHVAKTWAPVPVSLPIYVCMYNTCHLLGGTQSTQASDSFAFGTVCESGDYVRFYASLLSFFLQLSMQVYYGYSTCTHLQSPVPSAELVPNMGNSTSSSEMHDVIVLTALCYTSRGMAREIREIPRYDSSRARRDLFTWGEDKKGYDKKTRLGYHNRCQNVDDF